MRISDWSSDVCSSDLAEQFGDRDEAAAIVAQVDDDVGDPLVAERLESGAQLRRGRADKGAQVDIAIIAHARSAHLRAIAVGNRVDVILGLSYGVLARSRRLGHPQHPVQPPHIAAERVDYP